MPRYKLSPEDRAAERERKEHLRNIMKGSDVKNFDDLKDVFKLMVGEMLENGLDGELDDELDYTKSVTQQNLFRTRISRHLWRI